MYFLTYHLQPISYMVDIAGAYLNCYIQADNVDEADKIARSEIKKVKWNILDRVEAYEIDANNISDEGLMNYEKALTDKIVFDFHTYPHN